MVSMYRGLGVFPEEESTTQRPEKSESIACRLPRALYNIYICIYLDIYIYIDIYIYTKNMSMAVPNNKIIEAFPCRPCERHRYDNK